MGKPRDERTTRTEDGRFAISEVALSDLDLGDAELQDAARDAGWPVRA